MNIKRTVELVLLVIGWALISAGMILFQIVNYEIFKRPAAIITVFSLVLGAFALGIAVYAKKITFKKTVQVANIIMIVLLTISFVLMILFTLIISMFQPLALSTASYIIMIVGFVFTILSALIGFILKSKSYLPIVSSVALILLMLSGITWAKTQNYATFNNIENRDNIFLFENGEAGYFTFRIPSLVTLDMDTLNNNGFKLKHDVLLATAEARKNSSRDEGKIDLVGKISSDNGKTWSKAFVILTSADTLGKVGNPTPVFDKTTCKLNMVYITATKASGYNYSTYNIQGTLLPDFSFSWGEPILIDGQKILKESATLINKQLMVGPGKAVQLTSGRLVVPCSNSGKSFALYSDDHGLTWERGGDAADGNECDIVELRNGHLMMVSRANTGCSDYHNKQYQRFSYSSDFGQSWYIKQQNSDLKTPICMSSLNKLSTGTIIISYPDCFLTRANLSYGSSSDGGKTFNSNFLYDGPAGYSCLAITSQNSVFILAEVGKVNYNEALVLLKVNI